MSDDKVVCPRCHGLKCSGFTIGMDLCTFNIVCINYDFAKDSRCCSTVVCEAFCKCCWGRGFVDWIDSLFLNNSNDEAIQYHKDLLEKILKDKRVWRKYKYNNYRSLDIIKSFELGREFRIP